MNPWQDYVKGAKFPEVGSRTPWGPLEGATEVAPGIWEVVTPSHGGVKLSPARNNQVHWVWRLRGGWYEADCDWAIPALTFAELCDRKTLKAALGVAIDFYMVDYLLVFGDRKPVLKRDLVPGDIVEWIAKVNPTQTNAGKIYSCFDLLDREEMFHDAWEVAVPDSVVGLVLSKPRKIQGRTCYQVSSPLGVSYVDRTYLKRINKR